MHRKLASVQVVHRVEPIEGADFIERVGVLGWQCVAKKGELRVGDPCVFFEIDSLLPSDRAWAVFMKDRGYRVRTVKLRKVLSQGLALPLHAFDVELPTAVDADVTELLGVTRYEPPLPAGSDVAGAFPGNVPKTDELRLQSIPGILSELARAHPFYTTLKLDGASCTVVRQPDAELQVCSRNFRVREGGSLYWEVAEKHRLRDVLPPGWALQGEVCGPGIQKNRLGLTEVTFSVFTVFDVLRASRLGWHAMVARCREWGVPTVPLLDIFDGDGPANLDEWLAYARGRYPGTMNHREGVVVRPVEPVMSDVLAGDPLSFKVLNNDFLLKED